MAGGLNGDWQVESFFFIQRDRPSQGELWRDWWLVVLGDGQGRERPARNGQSHVPRGLSGRLNVNVQSVSSTWADGAENPDRVTLSRARRAVLAACRTLGQLQILRVGASARRLSALGGQAGEAGQEERCGGGSEED